MGALTTRSPQARIRKPKWMTLPVVLGGAVILFWVLTALTVQWWAPHDPISIVDTRLLGPSWDHPLGTDALGRDVLSRTLYGARASMPVAAGVIVSALLLGGVVGAVAGFFGGWVDSFLMRLTDMVMAFPPILLAMVIAATLGVGIRNAAIAMTLVWWPGYARLLRGQFMAVKSYDHVIAAESLGASQFRLMTKHILPIAFTPLLVVSTMDFGGVVLLAASLSFIGLGAVPPFPEWGSMISEGSRRFYDYWIALGPGIAILTVVLGANFIGDGIRDLLDPRTKS
ncbi:MAG: ABC transporter permease [Chloroflexi bacterium]|nr:ABC transporter permease [Chloroflexota bacterium]MDA1145384.1 ABC transporter permease [Chloroflexota bacterium]